MTDVDRQQSEAPAEATPLAADLLGRFAERLGSAASVRTIFGEPIERGGVTIIPVAKVGLGMGVGAGRWLKGNGSGGGGGGGAQPYGFIQIADGEAVFKPIRDVWREVALPIAIAVSAALLPAIAKRLIKERRGAP